MSVKSKVASRIAKCGSLGFISLIALAHAAPAAAQDECGPTAADGTVVCDDVSQPYSTIRYEGGLNTKVILGEGVVVDGRLQSESEAGIVVAGDGDIALLGGTGTVVVGSIFPAVEVGSTSGSVTVELDEVYGLGTGIAAYAGGDVNVSANYLEANIGVHANSDAGNVNVNVGQAVGLGEGGAGIVAETLSGDININAGIAFGIGDGTQAIYAASELGDVNIDAGLAYAEGNFVQAITAFSFGGDGDVNLNAQQVSARGDYAAGIYAASLLGDIDIDVDTLSVDTFQGVGILAANDIGNVNINVGYAAVAGEQSRAIDVSSFGNVSLTSDDTIGTFGSGSNAVNLAAAGTAKVDAKRVYTYGDMSDAIWVVGNAAIINADLVEANGDFSSAINAGVAGDVAVDIGTAWSRGSTDGEYTVGVASSSGDVSVNVREGVTAQTGRAITALAMDGKVGITIQKDATVTGGTTAIQAAASEGATINIAGTAVSANGPVVEILDNGFGVEGPAEINVTSTGKLLGTLALAGGNDKLSNAGTFLTHGVSNFGGGNDVFNNAGVLGLRDSSATTITLAGLERLENTGTLTLANGRTGDRLAVDGTLHGADGSKLAIDLDLLNKTADLIEVGQISGRSELSFNALGRGSGLGLDGLRVLSAADVKEGASLILAQTSQDRGFVRFGLEFDGQDSWRISSDLNDVAYLGGAMAAGLRDLWRTGTDALSTHLVATRNSEGGGAWIQATGSDVEGKSPLSHNLGSTDLKWSGSHKGVQLGMETSFGPWRVGGTGGYGSAKIGLGGSEHSRFDIINAGLYGAYSNNGWFGQALLRADLVDLRSDWASVGFEDKGKGTTLGASLEAGYRGSLSGIWFEPSARVAWVNVSLPDQEGVAGDMKWSDGSALTGELGLRMGVEKGWAGLPVQPFVAMSLAREFGTSDAVTIDLPTEEVHVRADGNRTFGKFGGGLSFSSGRFSLYGQVDKMIGALDGVAGTLGARFSF